MTHSEIQNKLIAQFGTDVVDFVMLHDILTFEVAANSNTHVIQYLKEDPEMGFQFLTDVCGIHYPEYEASRQFAVVYHLHNWRTNTRIRIKCYVPAENPSLPSISHLFAAANWQERETYDFYGIVFEGHPQLKRILNMDEMQSFPLRKEYPLEDAGRTDKDDRFFGRTPQNC